MVHLTKHLIQLGVGVIRVVIKAVASEEGSKLNRVHNIKSMRVGMLPVLIHALVNLDCPHADAHFHINLQLRAQHFGQYLVDAAGSRGQHVHLESILITGVRHQLLCFGHPFFIGLVPAH